MFEKFTVIKSEMPGIFSNSYIIPLYQRAFAWEYEQIEQLIDDVDNFNIKKDNYYLGCLIVDKKDSSHQFEVIDGQQRLTVLFLLLSALGNDVKPPENSLLFAHRKRSDNTLKAIRNNTADYYDKTDDGILAAFKTIKLKLGRLQSTDDFIEKLKKVQIIRVKVPQHTDLNKYFEIMNNRGEQLEQQDILKANLMKFLDEDKRPAFARIWDACSNMSEYVHNYLSDDDKEYYFGIKWNEKPNKSLPSLNPEPPKKLLLSIDEIANSANIESDYTNSSFYNEENVRFKNLIISFRHLLLHALRVYEENINGNINDEELLSQFEEIYKNMNKSESKKFSEEFIICLLKCRFLLDNFMLKREFDKDKSDASDGKWSLQKAEKSDNNSLSYTPAYGTKDDNDEILILQSMLRVSYTTPSSMHWVTRYLIYLYKCNNEDYLNNAKKELERYAKEPVEEYIRYIENKDYSKGFKPQLIVLNYLDFLIWIDKKKQQKLKFEFRNSIEHWYPQKPIDNQDLKPELLNHIGNLCAIPSWINSKFSNNMPEAKYRNFKEILEKQGLKLQEMIEITKIGWGVNELVEHGARMIKLLKDSLEEKY